ncbi:halo-CC-star protein HcsL [Halorubrum sp. AD140]|uniref:halo-CC-star protein HcsL n=1 Tax=Halorubrum sp. AD140 TaxID=3050073 RepID=UPI002ACC687D|nr:halo-CC-star protein HcsL [Halorubrum sp. AD140]MDZ5811739.1 halo-CC-star protein HcsL [Halorubrum sp. AD140]
MSDAQDSDDAPSDSDAGSAEANVETALREFLDALRESETYRRFVAADEALQADADAMALLREYRQKQRQLQCEGFDESVMAELKGLQSELSDSEIIQRQQAAQDDLMELFQRTNDAVSDEIGEEFARSVGGGCC